MAAGDMQWQSMPSVVAKQAAEMRKIYAENAASEDRAAAARAAAGVAGPPPRHVTPDGAGDQFGAAASLAVTVRNLAKLGPINAVTQADNQMAAGTPQVIFAASDPAAAKARAVAMAVAKAQAEAEAYAAAVHRHVGAVLRVANTKPAINLPNIMDMFLRMEGARDPAGKQAISATTAAVQVDYQLLP